MASSSMTMLPDGRRRIHARTCSVRRIAGPIASEFLKANHSFGDAACRYRYGLYMGDTLVAVGTFSSLRNISLDGKPSRSCEWVRFACLDGIQVMGGMGKILNAFISDVHPGDVMSYAPEGYSGASYIRLGFRREGVKEFPSGASVKYRLTLL